MFVLKKLKNNFKSRKFIFLTGTIIISLIIYGILAQNYIDRYICTTRGSFFKVSVLYWLVISLLAKRIFSSYFHQIRVVWGKILCFLLIPASALYIEELIWNTSIAELSAQNWILNYILILLIEAGLFFIVLNPTITYLSILLFCWTYGMVNHYVLLFKGCPPFPSDILAIRTAAHVMGQYTYCLSDSIVYGTLCLLYILLIILYFPHIISEKYAVRKRILLTACGITELIASFIIVYSINFKTVFELAEAEWNDKSAGFRANGAPLTFLLGLQNMKIQEPDGYSIAAAESILSQYSSEENKCIASEGELPSIIVIMNESFSDLNVLGTFESEPYLQYYNALDDYVIKGYTYASVFGGGTCNSEFEFLTGHSMANFNGEIYPYQQLFLGETFNLVNLFSELGYETIAIHPCPEKNWNRKSIYQQFGFDDFLSIEDMENIRNIRWYASDAYNYEQVINAYENRSAPLFLFNVTLQNHGGYNEPSTLGDIQPVFIEEKYQQYYDVVTYLTLIRESDSAFADLINYFSQQEDPVIICMFGDHQPSLNEKFYDTLMGSEYEIEKKFMTPYIIWSNYDLGIEQSEFDMSINYLGVNLLNLIGLHTDYTDFLSKLEETIPVINSMGYQTNDGKWHQLNEENELLTQYEFLQYYELFDVKGK